MNYSQLVAVLKKLDGHIADDTFIKMNDEGELVIPATAFSGNADLPPCTYVSFNEDGDLTSVFNRVISPKFTVTADGVEAKYLIPADLLTKLCALAQALQYAKAAKALLAALNACEEDEEALKTATLVKPLCMSFFSTNQALYELSEPVSFDDESGNTRFVIVSSINFAGDDETRIFPATEHGDVLDWADLTDVGMSSTSACSHEAALAKIGFTLVGGAQ